MARTPRKATQHAESRTSPQPAAAWVAPLFVQQRSNARTGDSHVTFGLPIPIQDIGTMQP